MGKWHQDDDPLAPPPKPPAAGARTPAAPGARPTVAAEKSPPPRPPQDGGTKHASGAPARNPEPTAALVPAPLSPGASALVRQGKSPAESAHLLAREGQTKDAIFLLAHLLPVPTAIRWALNCLKESIDLSGPGQGPASDAMKAVEQWLAAPSDANAREAFSASERAGLATPSGTLALAAFLAGGNMAPPGVAAVAPPPGAAARAVAGALALAAVAVPRNAPARFSTFFESGARALLEYERKNSDGSADRPAGTPIDRLEKR